MASPNFAIFLQDACLKHQYIRTKDNSNIVERPERLRAVNIGIAAALSRIQDFVRTPGPLRDPVSPDELAAALQNMEIGEAGKPGGPMKFYNVVKSTSSANILDNPAIKFVHGDIERDVYLEKLIKWARESEDNIAREGTEILSGLSQGDLYLCPGSTEAIQGALGTVCEAVDSVFSSAAPATPPPQAKRVFVAIRPPGHHCGEDTPSGFCFVNNVAVAAAHAHLIHGVKRVVIFDIDLHHGNGTQSIVWQINEETYRNTLEEPSGSAAAKPGPRIFYGSIHDILSYPCEDGKPDLVQAASTSIHGPHGQHIENIHLEVYSSQEEFWDKLYAKKYAKLITKAEEFLDATGGPGGDVAIFISCGFDACEHEYPSMQRHGRRVPTSFYYRFTRYVCTFAEKYAKGRIISVLEGGYSDRALISGAMAHVVGLSGIETVDEDWWSVEHLSQIEQATKKRRGGRPSHTEIPEWLQRTLDIFASIDAAPPARKPVAPPSSISLRERTKPTQASSSPRVKRKPESKPKNEKQGVGVGTTRSTGTGPPLEQSSAKGTTVGGETAPKKLPRVILKLGPQDSPSGGPANP